MSWFRRKTEAVTLTGAAASLTATHAMAEKPEPHEHTWNVRVWSRTYTSAAALEWALKEVLKPLQGRLINFAVPSGSGEDLARYVHRHVGSVFRVEVEREGRWLAAYEAEPVGGDWAR
jgi:hypothetical protein